MTHRNGTPTRSATESTQAFRPPPAGPQCPTHPGWSDQATLSSDTAAAAGDQKVGERSTPEPHAALSSATGDIPCRQRQQPCRSERATSPANITHSQTPATDEKAPKGAHTNPDHTPAHQTRSFGSPQCARRSSRSHGVRLLHRLLQCKDERHHTGTTRTIGSDTNVSAVGAPLA